MRLTSSRCSPVDAIIGAHSQCNKGPQRHIRVDDGAQQTHARLTDDCTASQGRVGVCTFGHALEHRRQELGMLTEELVNVKLHAAEVV